MLVVNKTVKTLGGDDANDGVTEVVWSQRAPLSESRVNKLEVMALDNDTCV